MRRNLVLIIYHPGSEFVKEVLAQLPWAQSIFNGQVSDKQIIQFLTDGGDNE